MNTKISKETLVFIAVFVGAFLLRVALRIWPITPQPDLHWWRGWLLALENHGLSGFYERGITNYPPVYLYALWIIGHLRGAFGWALDSVPLNIALAFPAIVADLAIGGMVYSFALKMQRDTKVAMFFAGAWLFNPAVLVNSVMWGQVDTVMLLPLVASLLFLKEKKLMRAYILFGVGLLVKPQAIMLGPIYLYSAIAYAKEGQCEKGFVDRQKNLVKLIGYIASAAGIMLLISLPFANGLNIRPIISQFFSTIGTTFNYTSLNAYNFFTLVGGNFEPWDMRFLGFTYLQWAVLFIGAIIVFILAVMHKDYPNKQERTVHSRSMVVVHRYPGAQNLFLVAAALCTMAFMFSVRMHERYLIYALPFILFACVETKDKRKLWLFALLSLAVFTNTANVLIMGWYIQRVAAMVNVLIAAYLVWVVVTSVWSEKNWCSGWIERFSNATKLVIAYLRTVSIIPHMNADKKTQPPPRMKLRDWGLLFILMMVLAIAGFTNLGRGVSHIPSTAWQPTANEFIIVDFGEVTEIRAMQFYNGHPDNMPFMIAISDNDWSWRTIYTSRRGYTPFQWGRVNFPAGTEAKYLELRPFGLEGFDFREVAFRGANNELLPPPAIIRGGETAYRLFDEQHLVPDHPSFLLGIYFDEAHHVRTAYDYVHGLGATEWTHPPMGKNFIAMGIESMGMSPFAWRFPGVLFGLAMIPLMYAFARHLFKSNRWALFAVTVFGFDFMRFTQTRIATIDTYVTFFVIAMYFFMYLYVSGVNTRSFKKSTLFLLLCGASMGFAIASKWQGIYAAVGLPILFYPVWHTMFKEDVRRAMKTVWVCVVAFIAVPLAIYILSYIPFVIGHGGEGIADGLRIIWENQVAMLSFHGNLVSDHPYGSPWWSWPLMQVPFHYYARNVDGLRVSIVAFGNPAIWWFGIFATAIAIYRLVKPKPTNATSANERKNEVIETDDTSPNRDYTLIFLLLGYGMQYLPWILVSRETYIYHYFPSVPFVVLIITWFFKTQVKRPWIAVAYVAIVIGLFAVFYPVLSGTPVDHEYITAWLRWVPGVAWR